MILDKLVNNTIICWKIALHADTLSAVEGDVAINQWMQHRFCDNV